MEETAISQNIKVGYKKLVEEALAEIEEISAGEAMARKDDGKTLIVDIRDIRELEREGRIPGAFHCPRGMLEFWIDPESPYHKDIFAEDRAFVFCCGGGLRSALATQIARRMGLKPVSNLAGGFAAWREAGGAVEPYQRKSG